MSRVAPRVHVGAAGIARLEALALHLPQDQCVHLLLEDGREVSGIVSAMPSVQAFFDPGGREGMNALVRIEPTGTAVAESLWLDQIVEVMRLPNPSPPQASRASPRDPNAPSLVFDRVDSAGPSGGTPCCSTRASRPTEWSRTCAALDCRHPTWK